MGRGIWASDARAGAIDGTMHASMHRALPALVALLPIGLVTGCELVFGLDDYAQASSEVTTGSSGTGTGQGAGAGPTGASDATGTGGGDGGSSAEGGGSSSSGGPSCPCVPDGWVLKEAYPTTAEAELRTCGSGINAARAFADPEIACECSCAMDDGLDCQLACWPQAQCQGQLALLSNAICAQLGNAASCAQIVVQNGAVPDSALCIASGTVVSSTNANVFDLCTASADGETCDDDGVCDDPSAEATWCIEGPAEESCPAGWPDDHLVVDGGTPACDCTCNDDITCDGNFRLGNNTCVTDGFDITTRDCVDVPERENYTAGPQPFADDAIDGGCSPGQNQGPGHIEGATETRLCCMGG